MERVRTPGEASESLCAFSLAEVDGCSGVAASSFDGVGGGAGTGVGAGASRRSNVPSIVCCWSYILHFALLQQYALSYYHYITLLLPRGKVRLQRAACKGCLNPTPCWTRQI
jgi:hypothetical protein